MKIQIFKVGGKTIDGNFDLVAKEAHPSLIAQAIRVYGAQVHHHLGHVKTRGEVNISTRKIYKQKGTGNARHGAKSAPIFVGGGIAHGPKGMQRPLNLLSQVRAQALAGLLFLAEKQKKVVGLEISGIKKTKEASAILSLVAKEKPFKKGLLLLSPKNQAIKLCFRNLSNLRAIPLTSVNVFDIYQSDLVILDADLVKKETKKGNIK